MTAPKLPPEVEEALSLVLSDAPARGTCDELLLRAAIAAHVAPPVSASFEEALAALDVEPTHHPDKMVTTYAILGIDDVRAAHRREVAEQVDAIRKERDEARGDARGNYLNILEVTALARTGTGPVKYADPVLEDAAAAVRVLLQERAAHAEAVEQAVIDEQDACVRVLHAFIEQCEPGDDVRLTLEQAEQNIRARGVAKPRTDGEAATRSGEGDKS